MEAILKFNLDDPDDKLNHRKAIDGEKAHLVIWEINQWLRKKLKYEQISDEQYTAFEQTQEELSDLIISNHLDIE